MDASSHNNGNVTTITNLADGTRSQQFAYDQVNRIVTAETTSTYATSPAHCWGEAYVYDNSNATPGEYGNLTNINVASTAYNGCTQESLSVAANTSNQLTAFSYDASGNVLNDTHNSYAWNAESEIKTAAGVTYTYDGDGNRVQKSNGKIYWYGAGTEVLDESDASGNITDEYVFFGGKRVAHRVVSGNVISYYGEDFLGSSRQIYNSASALCYDADFYPFGGERPYTNTCAPTYKFEGKERDTETGNDDFGARYYSSSFGRWTSPDWSAVPAPVPYANLTNPQTLNLYAMVSDNPETFADLDGHGTADWQLPNTLDYNTSQSADFRCAGGPSATCGSSPVASVQSSPTEGQNQAQSQTSDQPAPKKKLVLGVTSETDTNKAGPTGVVPQKNLDYTVGTIDNKGNFAVDTSIKGHTVTMTETKTGGNDSPTLCNPSCGPANRALDDHINVTGTGKNFTTTQTFHIDNQKEPATVYRRDPKTGNPSSGTHAYVTATDKSVNVAYGP